MDWDRLIYLDPEFISRKFEEVSGVHPGTTFSAQAGHNAQIGAFGLSAGGHTQESRQFHVSSREMLSQAWTHLRESYPTFAQSEFSNGEGTQLAWVQGDMTLCEYVDPDTTEPGYEIYELISSGRRVSLLGRPEYFAAGFGQIFSASQGIKLNIRIPVEALVRVMWYVENGGSFTCCPYVVLERNH